MIGKVNAQTLNLAIGETGGDEVTAIGTHQNMWITAGTFQQSLGSIGYGGSDVFLQQYNAMGQVQWQYNWGSANDDVLKAMTCSSSGAIYTTGTFSDTLVLANDTLLYAPRQTIFITKHNQQGGLLWARKIESPTVALIEAIITDDDDNVYLTGAFLDRLTLDGIDLVGNASKTAFVAKMDAEGNFLWGKTAVYSTENSEGIAITINDNNQLYVAGHFQDYFAFEQDTFQAHPAFTDIFMVQLNSNGIVLREQAFGGVYTNTCTALKWHDNALYMAGSFEGVLEIGAVRLVTAFRDWDGFIAKFYPNGTTAWASQSLTEADCRVEDLVVSNQTIAVVGHYEDTLTWSNQQATAIHKNEAFLLYLNNQGEAEALNNWMGGGFDLAKSFALNQQGALAVVGTFQDTMFLADTLLVADGFSDGFLRIEPWLELPNKVPKLAYQLVDFKLIPNPVVDSAIIELPMNIELEEWLLFNTNGQIVRQGQQQQISLSMLESGTYSLQIRTKQGIGIEKIIKQ